jgi:hypothetical protein
MRPDASRRSTFRLALSGFRTSSAKTGKTDEKVIVSQRRQGAKSMNRRQSASRLGVIFHSRSTSIACLKSVEKRQRDRAKKKGRRGAGVLVGPQAGRKAGRLAAQRLLRRETHLPDVVPMATADRCTRPRLAQVAVPLFYRNAYKAQRVPCGDGAVRIFSPTVASGSLTKVCVLRTARSRPRATTAGTRAACKSFPVRL